jgi:hypothetical protein
MGVKFCGLEASNFMMATVIAVAFYVCGRMYTVRSQKIFTVSRQFLDQLFSNFV